MYVCASSYNYTKMSELVKKNIQEKGHNPWVLIYSKYEFINETRNSIGNEDYADYRKEEEWAMSLEGIGVVVRRTVEIMLLDSIYTFGKIDVNRDDPSLPQKFKYMEIRNVLRSVSQSETMHTIPGARLHYNQNTKNWTYAK